MKYDYCVSYFVSNKTQFIWTSKDIIIMLQKISISIDFSDDILLIPVEWLLCRLHVYVNIPVTRCRCSTPEDMPVCCRAVVGPEPLLDIRSEPPPPPAGTSPSSCNGCFASAAHLHMFYCTLPIYLSSNCQDKQFDLQTWTSCLNVSAHFNMEENILHPYGTDKWDAYTQRAFFKQICIMWCLLDYEQYYFSVNHRMERLMKKPQTFLCTHPTPPHPLLWAIMGIYKHALILYVGVSGLRI